MKFKLSYKIFAAFATTSLLVVALMVGLIRFYVTRNFADYANRSLLERYSDFADALATEYQTGKGWQALKDHPDRWEEILQASLPRKAHNVFSCKIGKPCRSKFVKFYDLVIFICLFYYFIFHLFVFFLFDTLVVDWLRFQSRKRRFMER